jgi:glycosyltransferase involved in cell wall biosynthesis
MCKEARMTITVDSNFLNQARIKLRHHFRPGKIHFIPNFAEPQEKSLWSTKWHNPQEINILFARRFEFRRGVTIFAEAIEQILDKAPNVNVTFAGWGSHYDYLFEKFKNSKRVLIQAIPHHEINNHFNRSHIAVIPSTYSEGTSLSCLEAMASGCAVISSDVGGLCNLVLPDYNGLLIRPLAQEIEDALNKLINNLPLAEEIANRGYDTVCKTFSIFNWRQRIQQALAEAGIPDLSK